MTPEDRQPPRPWRTIDQPLPTQPEREDDRIRRMIREIVREEIRRALSKLQVTA